MYSIIIPLYNKEKYIARALTSVLNQTLRDFEVIIVNDGSTDRSIEVINGFKDKRIKIISQENSGVSVARNTGIQHAKYDLIAFLDADDTWHKDFLMAIKYLIEACPEAGAYYSNYKIVNKASEENIQEDQNYDAILIEDYFEFAITNKYIWTSCTVVKRSVFDSIGKFPEQYTRGEDLFLWTKIALKYRIAYTSKIRAFYYRDIPNSLTRRKFNIEVSFSNDAEDFYIRNKEKAFNKDSFREYMINIILSKAKYLILMNKKEEARLLLSKYINTKYHKKKVRVLYFLSYLPSKLTHTLTN